MRVACLLIVGLFLVPIAPVALVGFAQDKQQPAPQEYDKLGAFEVVRWKEDSAAPEVELGGIKYELKEVQDLPIAKVVEFCKKNYPKDWRKAFEEDLVEVLSKMGKPPEGTVKIKVKPVEGEQKEDRTFEGVWLTEANLDSIIKNRQVVVAGAGAGAVVAAPAGDAKRVERKHSAEVAPQFKPLTERIEPRSPQGRDVLPRKQAEEDLDELEWQLNSRFAFLTKSDLDYRAAFDSVRAGVGDNGIPRGAFALQLHRLLALFADEGTAAMIDLREDLPEGYLPFLTAEVAGGKIVAYDPGGAGLVDLDRPVLASLDGVDIGKWVDAAKSISGGGSPQAVRRQAVANLRYVNFLRDRLGLPRKETLSVGLAAAGGAAGQPIDMKLAAEPVKPPLPREGLRRTLEGNVGYLRLASSADDPNFLAALHAAMGETRGTDGLVIDLRRGGGGGRAAVRELLPYFIAADEDPQVIAVGAYRLSAERNEAPDAREGYLEDRFMYPATSTRFIDEERQAIAKFAKDFEPQWKPPVVDFSAWHCMVASPRKGGPFYHYGRPVVVLTDSGSVGAAELLGSALKGRKGVTVMGTPTAGAVGRSEAVRLANGGVAVRVSTAATYRPDGKLFDGQGVEPDVEKWPEPDDFIGRTDSVLEAARKKVKGD